MGFLLVAGMIGSIVASGYTVKKEIECGSIDSIMKPTYKNGYNFEERRNIRDNFGLILKRSNIKYNKSTKRPTEYAPNPCIAYLRKQGYKEEETSYFKELYDKKYEEEIKEHNDEIKDKHTKFQEIVDNAEDTRYYTFRIHNMRDHMDRDIEHRAEILLQNKLWRSLVDNYTHYRDNHERVEVWNLNLPWDIGTWEVKKIYMEVCEQQNVHNSIW